MELELKSSFVKDPFNIIIDKIILPNKPLSNYELLQAVKDLKIRNFRGVFLRDELPNKPRMNECGIINLADSKDLEGTHWTCYFQGDPKGTKGIKDPRRVARFPSQVLGSPSHSSKKEWKVYYFDSYGIQPPIEIVKYLGSNTIQNTFQIQDFNQVVCGHLCLYVLFHLNKGKDFNEIIFSLISNP